MTIRKYTNQNLEQIGNTAVVIDEYGQSVSNYSRTFTCRKRCKVLSVSNFGSYTLSSITVHNEMLLKNSVIHSINNNMCVMSATFSPIRRRNIF
jgi:hypothetical protein